jgi:hypothetical protein
MSFAPAEDAVRAGLHNELDPMVPDAAAERRVLSAIAEQSRLPRRRPSTPLRLRDGFAGVMVAAVVVLFVGGVLTVRLALRDHSATIGHGATSAPASQVSAGSRPTGAVLPCDGDVLTARRYDQASDASAMGGDIALRNIGRVPCTLEGYVNLEAIIGGQTTQLVVAHDLAGALLNSSYRLLPEVQLVTVQPGYEAFVAVEVRDVATSPTACPAPDMLLITPTQGHRYVVLSGWQLSLCAAHGTALWIDEAPVSATPYFSRAG